MLWRSVSLFCSLFASHALACTVPPANWSDDPYSMVTNTPTIGLAKASRVERDGQTTTSYFETIEVLRGTPPEAFSLRGWFDTKVTDFSGHRDPSFWVSNSAGGAITPGDCNAYGVFEANQSYLIFLDGPNHPRSFENVRSTDDLWYQTVSVAIATLKTALEKR